MKETLKNFIKIVSPFLWVSVQTAQHGMRLSGDGYR